MSGFNLISTFARLSLRIPNCSRTIFSGQPLLIQATPSLWAEPLKKKKRLDPAIIKAREERRRKRLEKQIRRLEKNARQLKPIPEVEVPFELLDEKKLRERQLPSLSYEEAEKRVLLMKDWARYKLKQHVQDLQTIDRLINAQQRALDELRQESEELYQEAIQIDLSLIPFVKKGPVHTPPIKNYDSPDGEYIDISKNWDVL